MPDFIPLISTSFHEHTPESFHAYVRSLYKEPQKPAPLPEVSITLNAKGNPVITVRREPKFLLPSEVDKLASEIGWRKQDFWLLVTKRKIEVKLPARGKNDRRAPSAKPGRTTKRKSTAVKPKCSSTDESPPTS